MDLADLADGPVPDPLVEEAGALSGVALVPHLGDEVPLLRFLAQKAGLLDGVGERLLAEDVLAHLHGRHRYDGVIVVGHRDGDGVEVPLLLEHPPEVAVLGGLCEHGLLFGRHERRAQELGHHEVVDVAEGADVLGADAHDVRLPLSHDADTADVQRVARRLVPPAAEDMPRDDDHTGRRGGRPAHELATG